MNLLPKRFISRHQTKLLLFVIWLHVSILDFLYVSYRGPVFLYKETLQVNTLLTHALIALLTLACALLVIKFFVKKDNIITSGNNLAEFKAKVTEE